MNLLLKSPIDKRTLARASLLCLALALTACSKGEDKSGAPAGQPSPVVGQPEPATPGKPGKPTKPAKPTKPKPQPKPDPGQGNTHVGTPAWGSSPERRAWTNAVREVVENRFQDFDRARDKDAFCPGYSAAGHAEKVNCFVMLVAAVSKFESNFHTGDSFREPDGNYSIGLLALSPNECPNARTHEALKNPVQNLICGTNMMARLIARDGAIDGPEGRRGAASYWSTLRTPYKRWDGSRKRYLNLGYRLKILPMVRGYRAKGRTGLVLNGLEEALTENSIDEQVEEIDRDYSDKEHGSWNDDRDFYEPR